MPGKKRSATTNGVNTSRGAPSTNVNRPREHAGGGKEIRQAFCPTCGTAHGYKRLGPRKANIGTVSSTVNYWEWLKQRDISQNYSENRVLGSIQAQGLGRGHDMQLIGYFGPEDDPDGFFPLVKERLLQAVKRWHDRGWINQADLDQL